MLDKFRYFKRIVEKNISVMITCLKMDYGGEFAPIEFNEFCERHDIMKQLTQAKMPHKNGIVQ